jgi:3-isopropylmalate/(R)-2-methylmalate dehydratase large subunit
MGASLFDKVWDLHTVRELPSGQSQLLIGLHLIHEVTSPQGFQMLDEAGLKVLYPDRTIATVDHIVPTDSQARPFADMLAERMLAALERNCRKHGIRLFEVGSGRQGIVHVIGPQLGIGTSQVRDVLASQCLALARPRVRRIEVSGTLGSGVYAKDLILHIIRSLGVKGGIGYAYEYAGAVIEACSMEERMTLCNMSIEGGARVGYVNPDSTTFDYLRGREFAPQGEAFERAVGWWQSIASDADARYDDRVSLDGGAIAPMVTWGINPGQAIGIDEKMPRLQDLSDDDRGVAEEAFAHMDLRPGDPIEGTPIDVAFIGSCTNGRLSDLREAARVARGGHVAPGVRALVVPGSEEVKRQAEDEGLDEIFRAAGFAWREAGCSMCLAMNPDKLVGREICASTSNRNFKGRQGSPTGRTLLMSPAMVAAAALNGRVTDARGFLA